MADEVLYQGSLEDLPPEQQVLILNVEKTIKKALENYVHPCRFDTVEDVDTRALGQLLGMIEELGGGRVGEGIEYMRENHKWIHEQITTVSTVKKTVIKFIAISGVGVLLAGILAAFKQLLGK